MFADDARAASREERPIHAGHRARSDSRHVAFVGLGSNLGNRAEHLQRAVEQLDADPHTTVRAISPVYESRALTLGPSEASPDFLNAVVRLQTSHDPLALLHLLQEVERAEGRTRTRRWEPRTLDLDLLLFDDYVEKTRELALPHPGIASRGFVLRPLADLAPELLLPAPLSTSVYSLLKGCPHVATLRRTDVQLHVPGLR